MIVTELSRGTKLFLLVGGKGTRISSVTNGLPKAMIDINGKRFIKHVIENLKGFDITLVCSDLNYHYFTGDLTLHGLGVDIFNEGEPSGTGGFLTKIDLPESFYVMNGDTFYSGDINLDCDESTIFVTEKLVSHDEGYVIGKDGKVKSFVEKSIFSRGEKQLVNLGIYKFYKKDLNLPYPRLPLSMEYDILTEMDLSYKVLNTHGFDIGTPERLKVFEDWMC